MNPFSGSSFAVLTLIAAPAILTNASSVLALNTANRFGRVIDRSRQLVEELERWRDDAELNPIRMRQMSRLRRRAVLLLRAQTAFYAALGLFVAGALLAIAGAALSEQHPLGAHVAALGGFVVGAGAAGSLIYGCVLLVRETRLALQSLSEETTLLEARARPAA